MTHPVLFFFFNDTATTEIYTLSLHDALPIFLLDGRLALPGAGVGRTVLPGAHADQHIPHPVGIPGHVREDMTPGPPGEDRKSTRLNSSHGYISYAVFCLKKKKRATTAICPPA